MKSENGGILNSIIRFSLSYRFLIITLACALLFLGFYALTKAKYDVFPEFAPPQVVVQTEAPGLAPEQVELLATKPVENALNGINGIESIRSGSIQGLSVITITFRPGIDIYRARQMVTEQLASIVGSLPKSVRAPQIAPLTTSTSVVLVIGLTSDTRTLMDIRTVADWTVKQRLLSVPGVSKVTVFGGEVKQFQIQINPESLLQYNISMDDVLDTARRATGIRGAGFIDTANQRIVIQSEGQSLTTEQLSKTSIIQGSDNNIKLNITIGDVAKVVEAPEHIIGVASIMGKPGVQLVISAQYGANTLEVTRKVEQALDELVPTLKEQGITLHTNLFRPANFITTSVRNINTSLLIGAILVVVVLFLFLFNLRTAAISCTAIPLSLLSAATILQYFGFTLNTMTLGGLAIAIGEVVDDAVIDVENILRRLRENKKSTTPKPVFQVILDASIEVRSAVVYATFSVILVFVPILTMSGLSGRLFAPLGLAYILAVIVSLLVALTVTPALCFILMQWKEIQEKESSLVQWLKEKYRVILWRVEEYPKIVAGAIIILVLSGLSTIPFMGGSFMPELNEGHFIVHMSLIPGTSLQESMRMGRRVSKELLTIPFVRAVAQRAGRAELADDIYGTFYSEMDVDLKPKEGDQTEIAQGEIRKRLSKFPGVIFTIRTFLTERVEETLSGYTAPLVINVFGSDLKVIDEKAREVARIINKIPGATEVQVQSPPGTPQLVINLKKDKLLQWGLDPVDVLDITSTAYSGETVGQVYEGNRVFDATVILAPKNRNSISKVGSLLLRTPAGIYVHLSELADISESSGRYSVLHEGARRVQAITCNVSGKDIKSFSNEVKKQIRSNISFPPGTYVEFTGTAESQAQSQRDLIVHSLLTGIGIILLLSIVMKNYQNLILILTNLPFALVGGILIIFISGGAVSVGSMVGFVTLFGITLRNSIMMLSHYEHLVSNEGLSWNIETAVRGATERLTPILMTALITGLGLLPLAIGSGAPGREIEGPMAMVILGGLLTSTVLNLLVLPTLAFRFGKFENKTSTNWTS